MGVAAARRGALDAEGEGSEGRGRATGAAIAAAEDQPHGGGGGGEGGFRRNGTSSAPSFVSAGVMRNDDDDDRMDVPVGDVDDESEPEERRTSRSRGKRLV